MRERTRVTSIALLLPASILLFGCGSTNSEEVRRTESESTQGIAASSRVTQRSPEYSDSVEVRLSVDERSGVVSADPDPAKVLVGGTITWTSESRAWAVHFPGITPLKNHRRFRGRSGETAGDEARLPGRHKYFVVVQGEDGLLYTADPDAEIKPRNVQRF